jgi:hypothetical protein
MNLSRAKDAFILDYFSEKQRARKTLTAYEAESPTILRFRRRQSLTDLHHQTTRVTMARPFTKTKLLCRNSLPEDGHTPRFLRLLGQAQQNHRITFWRLGKSAIVPNTNRQRITPEHVIPRVEKSAKIEIRDRN